MLVWRARSLVWCLLFSLACQTYDFEPVTPITLSQTTQSTTISFHRPKPNMMLVVDRSGSMDSKVTCGGPSCPTRLDEVKTAMGNFLSSQSTLARFGMVPFAVPNADDCQAPTAADIPTTGVPLTQTDDVPSQLQATAVAVQQKIQGLDAGGSTPTGATLHGLLDYAPILDEGRNDFLLLLTDGFPNCNLNNANTCSEPAACRCTFTSCSPSDSTCTLGCLDEDGTVAEVAALRAKNVRTIIVGFGADLGGGTAVQVLNALSDAGGFGRPCSSDADCAAGDTCNTTSKQCGATHFYVAQDAVGLAQVLTAISGGVVSNPCFVLLDETPADPGLLSVEINGQLVLPGAQTWQLEGGGKVRFQGDLCDQLTNATQPTDLSFRILRLL